MARAAAFFAGHGISRIERVMSDNAFGYRKSVAFAAVLADLGARHILIRPHCPWTNGKVCVSASLPPPGGAARLIRTPAA